MRRHIESPIKLGLLASTIAALSLGCVLDLDKLDAGQDDDSADDSGDDSSDPNDPENALECTIGSEIDATGTQRTSWTPQCTGGIVCAEGWGHDPDPLPIEWTTQMPINPPDSPHTPRAIGLFENGRVVVAIEREGAIGFEHFEPDGLNYGGYDVEGIGDVDAVEIIDERAYVTHGIGDGTIYVTAIDIASQQTLWTRSFDGDVGSGVARGGGKLALTVWSGDAQLNTLFKLDLDGNTEWTTTAVEQGNVVAFSPAGDYIAVSGELTRVYSADDGDVLDEFVHGSLPELWPQSSVFLDEDRLAVIGSGVSTDTGTGWLGLDSLSGDVTWETTYDRADLWCPVDGDPLSYETAELLIDITRLPDDTLVVVGSESFRFKDGVGTTDGVGTQPWVAHVSPGGDLLASDRGLWNGHAIDAVAGPDGSVFVLIGDGAPDTCGGPCKNINEGFAVRKYVVSLGG